MSISNPESNPGEAVAAPYHFRRILHARGKVRMQTVNIGPSRVAGEYGISNGVTFSSNHKALYKGPPDDPSQSICNPLALRPY